MPPVLDIAFAELTGRAQEQLLARDERLGEAALPSLAIVLVGLLPVVLLSRAMRDPADERP